MQIVILIGEYIGESVCGMNRQEEAAIRKTKSVNSFSLFQRMSKNTNKLKDLKLTIIASHLRRR